jgi:nitrogen fixation protein FixH
MATREITGRQVFFVTAGAFGVIIAVNVFMAWSAISTFPGLEAKNSYAASQTFEAERDAQDALGWTVEADVADGFLVLSITNADGAPVQVTDLSATLGRATHVNDDRTPIFQWRDGTYVGEANLAPGNWNLRMTAMAADGTPFRQRVVIYVK